MGWYECDVSDPPDEEPDWSRVPTDKRETVRTRWLRANRQPARRCLMWGPQIEFFRAQGSEITVIGPASYTPSADQLPPGRNCL
jgi:hypothetical protein